VLSARDGDSVQGCGERRGSTGDGEERQSRQAIHDDVFDIAVRWRVALSHNYAADSGQDRQGGQHDSFASALSQRLYLLRGGKLAVLRDPLRHSDPVQHPHPVHELRCLQLNRQLCDACLLHVRSRSQTYGNIAGRWN